MDYQYDENFDSHFPQDLALLSGQGADSHGTHNGSLEGSNGQTGMEEVNAAVSFPNSSSTSPQEDRKSATITANSVISNSDNSSSKPKRTRARGEALDILKREFETNPNPTSQRRKKLSEMTGLPEKNVRIWFQNRRAKLRKDDRAGVRDGSGGLTGDNTGDSNAFYSYDNGENSTLFDQIPLNINNNYYFIDICSITVGSWNRMKSGALRKSNWSTVKDLSNLSPISINEIMSNATDLMVLISKKNFEINYFFSAMANNTKILFRIFFPINSVVNCSLSLEANDIIEPRNSDQQDDENGESSLGDDNRSSNEDSEKLGELKINVSRPPNFAVYFLEAPDEATNNQWSICEDFSEGRQVNDAFIGGSNLPHALKGLQNSLRFMNSLILDYNSTNQIIPPPPPQPFVMDSNPLSMHHPSATAPTPFFDQYDDTSNDVLGLEKDPTTTIKDAGSHNSSNNNMNTSNDGSNLLSLSHDNQLQGMPDFFKSPPELTDDTRWL
ncbi:hypothetical protein ZYGR_0A03170 [Zygosaccharomyces rouxii]|uniref:ZYRO0A07194p n=2 Tax=Zygosaccharomyces rouxii TaxID=4956 RepID=C5DPY7_ZYGRC|nr:uncharacterized protein ZYRO0A07194g [Zygosaccharomyces rouxii]KAH9198731.1 hypothetical protein LQ764DRAFT_235711 [Zygosaccharomyces rouxii]GAV46722.1 hypothetical protein ZYGR_0A03170 [Zygosaccharomyces rouxii]CAR25748.1 ZYRO0A07194p [Zygosaccharomyces rouxii]